LLPPEEQNSVKQLAGIAKENISDKSEVRSDAEAKLRELTGKSKGA